MDTSEKNFAAAYSTELGQMQFSDPQKDQLVENILAAGAELPERQAQLTHRRPLLFKVAAAAAAVLIALGVGTHAYATGQLVSVMSAIEDIFGMSADTEIVHKVGKPVNAVAESGGVYFSADTIIGDGRNVAVVYSLWRQDGQSFGDVQTDDQGMLTIDGKYLHDDINTWVAGALGAGGSSYFYDADPADNAIQLVTMYSIYHDNSIIGASMHAHLEGISLVDADSPAQSEPLLTGSWDLTFKINYDEDQLELTPTGSLTVADTSATINAISVSPVAINIDYTVDGVEVAPPSGTQWSPSYLDLGTITVTMKDGTVMSMPSGSGYSHEEQGKTMCATGTYFKNIINPADIASVSFAGISATPAE
ncbi:MAG: DUF4179 domain-containing protein [Atopobiaceae bacterium]|jgi:hypothetical protein